MAERIITVENKKGGKILLNKTDFFDFKKFSRKEINELVLKMKKIMREAKGIGLSANQVGLNLSVFVAEVPDRKGGMKFYSIFNPKIDKTSPKKIDFEEGCLSIPLTYGTVERPERITLSGYDKNGAAIKIKAWGLLARVFQHEVDHLNGKIFTGKAKNIHKLNQEERIMNHE